MNILDFIFPKRCVSCGAVDSYLCTNCIVKIKFTQTPVCPVCERAAIGGATHPGCKTRLSLDGLISACVYDGPIKTAIKRLKYKPWITSLGTILMDLTVDYLYKNRSIIRIIEQNLTLIPTPLHKSRERERGFNQSVLIGKLLAQKLKLQFYPDFLCRHKKTKPQAELKGKERLENIKNAFSLSPNSPNILFGSAELAIRRLTDRVISQYPNILLVDDVWTTGATLRACTAVLKRAGCQKVWALTLAR